MECVLNHWYQFLGRDLLVLYPDFPIDGSGEVSCRLLDARGYFCGYVYGYFYNWLIRIVYIISKQTCAYCESRGHDVFLRLARSTCVRYSFCKRPRNGCRTWITRLAKLFFSRSLTHLSWNNQVKLRTRAYRGYQFCGSRVQHYSKQCCHYDFRYSPLGSGYRVQHIL